MTSRRPRVAADAGTASARAATLDDVAALAGVSTATVSRYINNQDLVAKPTGERIRAAIAATNYIPNLLAGGLASSRSKMVAVLIPYLSDSTFNDTMQAMAEELSAAGNTVMLGLTGTCERRTEDLVRAAISRRVDAIIFTGPVTPGVERLVRGCPVQFIQVWELPPEPIGVAVGFSHDAAGREIARFLRGRGYCRPHLVTARAPRARMRRDGFVSEWLASGGAAPTEADVPMPSRFGHARQLFAELRRLATMPDVVVCGSDALAQGVIVEAQAAGLRVPADLAVVGFGNNSIAGDMRPTITTVEIDGVRVAREAIAAIQDPQPGRLIDVGFRLIARESA